MSRGFWETFAGGFQNALGDYDRVRQEKRARALQKLKFLTEAGDVGSPVTPEDADLIRRHASEGVGMIDENSQFTGTPEQQRLNQFREMVTSNPNMDPMQMLTQGTALGAVSPNAMSNYLNSVEARNSREQIAREQIASREQIANDRNETQLMLRSLINANRGSGGGQPQTEDGPGGTNSDRQKWLARRKALNNDPYSYITQQVLNNPESALAEIRGAIDANPNDELDINSPDIWDSYYQSLLNPTERVDNINSLGLRNQEYDALLKHIQQIANKKRALRNANRGS